MCFCVLVAKAENLKLAVNGSTEYQIVIPDDADETNIFAAKELQRFLKQISNTDFKIVKFSHATEKKRIYTGVPVSMRKMLPEVDFSSDNPSRVIIRSKGSSLFLTGTSSSGTLLAVYSFLEDDLGCRWWTSKASTIPKKSNLTIDVKNVDYTPPFRDLRLAYYLDIKTHPVFATRLKNRTFVWYGTPQHKFLGGTLSVWPPYHSSFKLIPPKKYFSSHPEWFSMNDGKRTDNNQLCFSSDPDGLAQEILKNAKAYLDKNPNGILNIGQMDKNASSRCHCAKCMEIENAEGAASGPIIHFINKLADMLAKKYPKAKLMTFAYWYSEKAPVKVKVRDNVVIFLCAYDYMPFEKLRKSGFKKSLEKWSKICRHIYVWYYPLPYSHYLAVYPNYDNLPDDLKLFSEYKKVEGVFAQADSNCSIGDFVELRAWLLSHLLWQPNQDVRRLMREFTDAYYGAAGKYVYEYLILLQESRITGSTQTPVIPLKLARKCAGIYRKAMAAVADDQVLTERLLKSRTSFLDNVIQSSLNSDKYLEVLKVLGFKNLDQAIDQLDMIAKKYSTHQYKDGVGPFTLLTDKYRKASRQPKADPPEIYGLDLSKKVYFDIQEYSQTLALSSTPKIIDDSEASNGKAMRLGPDDKGWRIYASLSAPAVEENNIRKVTAYVRVKIDFEKGVIPPDAHIFTIGVYDKKSGMNVSRGIKYKDIKLHGKYAYYPFASRFMDTAYVWVGATGSKRYIKDIFVDRFVIVK